MHSAEDWGRVHCGGGRAAQQLQPSCKRSELWGNNKFRRRTFIKLAACISSSTNAKAISIGMYPLQPANQNWAHRTLHWTFCTCSLGRASLFRSRSALFFIFAGSSSADLAVQQQAEVVLITLIQLLLPMESLGEEEDNQSDLDALTKLAKSSTLSGKLEIGSHSEDGYGVASSMAWGVLLSNHGPPNFRSESKHKHHHLSLASNRSPHWDISTYRRLQEPFMPVKVEFKERPRAAWLVFRWSLFSFHVWPKVQWAYTVLSLIVFMLHLAEPAWQIAMEACIWPSAALFTLCSLVFKGEYYHACQYRGLWTQSHDHSVKLKT